MPELPDVEVYRRVLDSTSLNRRIAEVATYSDKVLQETPPEAFRARLSGQRITSSLRHGKYLFAGLLSGDHVGLHFGMSGALAFLEEGEEDPRHERCALLFQDGSRLVYISQRQLGRLFWIEDLEGFTRARELGPDALDADLDFHSFSRRLAARRGSVKSALMDQSVLAGIGNIYSDEILFQAKVAPTRRVRELGEGEVAGLYKAVREVLQQAIEADAQPEAMPPGFLLRCRAPDGACPRCGGSLRTVKVGGRRGYFCPSCQG